MNLKGVIMEIPSSCCLAALQLDNGYSSITFFFSFLQPPLYKERWEK